MDSTQSSDQHQSMLPQMHSPSSYNTSASDTSQENHGKYTFMNYYLFLFWSTPLVVLIHSLLLLLSCYFKRLLNQISYGMTWDLLLILLLDSIFNIIFVCIILTDLRGKIAPLENEVSHRWSIVRHQTSHLTHLHLIQHPMTIFVVHFSVIFVGWLAVLKINSFIHGCWM